MARLLVGTAGHIDHGKTSLVRALTGVDCDRWAEEKARGITIDLGFAAWRRDDIEIGFVDVPGHERFLHNALAGLGGIRVVMLVVAADEGVKPQTREHLAVCLLLGIPTALVALTKVDLVSQDLRELAELEVAELLAATPYRDAPIFPVSSVTGEGVPALEAHLISLASSLPPLRSDLPARLPIDRAFHLKGLGAIVTGTLVSGAVEVGDALELLPSGERVRIRTIQVHGESRERAEVGERTSLQLSGLPLEAFARGQQLVAPTTLGTTNRLLARFSLLADAPSGVAGFTPIRLHLFATEAVGRLRALGGEIPPGGEGLVEIRLASPIAAVRGDRFVIRRPSPATTLGGGEILDPTWRAPRGAALAPALAALSGELSAALSFWALDAGERGVSLEELARRSGVPATELGPLMRALASDQKLLEIPGEGARARRWIAPSTFRRIAERAARVLKEHFQRDRLAEAIPKAEAVRRILRGRGAEVADVYFSWLQAGKILEVAGDRVRLPGRTAELTGEESRLAKMVLERFQLAGLAPPSPGDVAQALGAKPQILEGVLRHLVARGEMVKLPSGLMLAASAIVDLRRSLLETDWERFSVADFKDRFGLSRKWAIPLLEHLDSTGATRRAGDDRLLVRK